VRGRREGRGGVACQVDAGNGSVALRDRTAVKDYLRAAARSILLNKVAASSLIPTSQRWRLWRALGADAEHCRLGDGIYLRSRNIHLGPGCVVQRGCQIDNYAAVTVGREVAIGAGAMIVTAAHDIGPARRRSARLRGEPVTIGDGTWIGSRAMILPGVTVGAGCVIAAGAVVTKDCAPNGLYAGVPARRVRDLAEATTAA
jgi:maltose O-acetyltransferase